MRRLAAVLPCCVALTACGSATPTVQRDPLKFASRGATVVETRVPLQITFEQFARNEPKMLRRALGAQQLRVGETRIGDRRTLRVTYLLPRKRVTQYFVRNGELMYVVTYTSKRA
jgi:hypothetical protein